MHYINQFLSPIVKQFREIYLKSNLYDKKISKVRAINFNYKPSAYLFSSLINYQIKKYKIENFTLDSWNQDIAVGLTGAFLCSKHYGNMISKNKDGGSIVNISSDLGLIAPDQRLYRREGLLDESQYVKPVSYSIVKTGLIGLTRYLASYWTDKKVRCNAICPGGVEQGQDELFLEEVSKRIPMNRLAQVDEYQGTMIWMLSDASSYLNGSIISVDGGRTAW